MEVLRQAQDLRFLDLLASIMMQISCHLVLGFYRQMMQKRQFLSGLIPSLKVVAIREGLTKYPSSKMKDNIKKNDMSKNVLVLAMKVIEYLKIEGKFEKNLVKINLLFIIIFLNLWDFVISREVLNGMVLVTLISIFEFAMILIFVLEGFELGGTSTTLKSVFWIPYLLMAAINGFWGLKIYSEARERKAKI